MPSTELLLAFLAATAVFAYLPGPGMLFAAAQTLAWGRRAGLMAALGLHLGGYAHVATAAAGLAVLFHTVPALFLAVKLIGAGYLALLGLRLMLWPASGTRPRPGPRPERRAFRDSVLIEVLNPKSALFFLAFLPQFVDPAAALPVWAQLLALGTVVNLLFSSADLICVALAGSLIARLERSARAQRLARAAAGLLLIGLAVHLALPSP